MGMKGFTTLALDEDLQKELDRIMKDRFCRTRPEAVRLLIRTYRDLEKEQKAYKAKENSRDYQRMPSFPSGDEVTHFFDENSWSNFMS